MLENSYDAKGMKFGIVILDNPEEYKKTFKEKYNRDAKKAFNSFDEDRGNALNYFGTASDIILDYPNGYRLVNFDDVDGLTIKEVDDSIGKYTIDGNYIVLMYSQFDTIRKPVYALVINKDKYRDNAHFEDIVNDEIGRVLNLDNHTDIGDIEKRYFQCFLERYCYGDAEKVNDRMLSKRRLNVKKEI